MAELDPGRVIRPTRELVAESKTLHESTRRTTAQSKKLKKKLQQALSEAREARRSSRDRRKRLLARSA